MEAWISNGKELGLTGEDLMKFVTEREQAQREREERAENRQIAREREREEREAQAAREEREAQTAREERQAQTAREQREVELKRIELELALIRADQRIARDELDARSPEQTAFSDEQGDTDMESDGFAAENVLNCAERVTTGWDLKRRDSVSHDGYEYVIEWKQLDEERIENLHLERVVDEEEVGTNVNGYTAFDDANTNGGGIAEANAYRHSEEVTAGNDLGGRDPVPSYGYVIEREQRSEGIADLDRESEVLGRRVESESASLAEPVCKRVHGQNTNYSCTGIENAQERDAGERTSVSVLGNDQRKVNMTEAELGDETTYVIPASDEEPDAISSCTSKYNDPSEGIWMKRVASEETATRVRIERGNVTNVSQHITGEITGGTRLIERGKSQGATLAKKDKDIYGKALGLNASGHRMGITNGRQTGNSEAGDQPIAEEEANDKDMFGITTRLNVSGHRTEITSMGSSMSGDQTITQEEMLDQTSKDQRKEEDSYETLDGGKGDRKDSTETRTIILMNDHGDNTADMSGRVDVISHRKRRIRSCDWLEENLRIFSKWRGNCHNLIRHLRLSQ